ncbi:hypothetical protein M413DRAFT_135409 [Hebeloma cylindrosporum]|uniref:Uncharacterized protein n=1 Tax=Hebeloma cylindrosporum TaxID=76867 RepID=A0A0C3BCY1_HEBCY|nr:hypothetical protein M413DRAFT_135409 [Hebeloma cylindrosporum h7]
MVGIPRSKFSSHNEMRSFNFLCLSLNVDAFLSDLGQPSHSFLTQELKKFGFEPRACATAEGNLKPDDLIDIYRKRTMIDSSGKETVTPLTYFVVDAVEVLSKFGTDAWDRVV